MANNIKSNLAPLFTQNNFKRKSFVAPYQDNIIKKYFLSILSSNRNPKKSSFYESKTISSHKFDSFRAAPKDQAKINRALNQSFNLKTAEAGDLGRQSIADQYLMDYEKDNAVIQARRNRKFRNISIDLLSL